MRAWGWSRRALRIAWRTWRSASAVTAQLLMTMASWRPAVVAWPRMTSASKAFSRQPKVTTSSSAGAPLESEFAAEADGDRPGHADVIVRQPFDHERAAVQHHFAPPARQLAPGGRHQRGASAGAAGPRDADAALPDPHADAIGRDQACDLDIGPIGKQGMALQHRPESGDIHAFRIGNEEHRMRIANIDGDRIAQRPEGEIEMQRVHGLRQRDLAPVQ